MERDEHQPEIHSQNKTQENQVTPEEKLTPSEAVALIKELSKKNFLRGLSIKDMINEGRDH
jgi:hypothetical protein